jgi:transcriptional regulator GlxA family with amidase domain
MVPQTFERRDGLVRQAKAPWAGFPVLPYELCAPWQIRRVNTHIQANLDAAIRVKELAKLVKLSSFHFCRAFRDSFDDSPHGYLMRRRLERAQGLMLTTNASLGQIAADCGLADQAHFNKLFRRFVGESPGMWRRARATEPR